MTGTRWLSLIAALVLIPASSVRRMVAHPLIVTYTPPEYIGGDPAVYDDAESVRGIEGGTVQILGRGDLEGVAATIGRDTLVAQPDPIGWTITLLMPTEKAVIHVSDGMEDRDLTLLPVRDSLPVVTLLEPARDTVVRSAHGKIHLVAQVSDDHGVAEAYFELVQSRTGRPGKLSGRRIKGLAQRLDALLNLDSLRLGPGDVLQLRAVARDFGPKARGLGVSGTRTYRVIRPNDLDTASVGAPTRPTR